VLKGVSRICEEAGISPADLANVVHGTTVATNAVLESKGARVGLITTQGFGQILHLARSQTPGPLAGWIIMVKPDPPASLADTREAVERLDARGNTLVAVDTESAEFGVAPLIVRFVFGTDKGPASLIAATDDRAFGHPQVAARWGDLFRDVIWAALTRLIEVRSAGQAPAGLQFGPDGLQLSVQTPFSTVDLAVNHVNDLVERGLRARPGERNSA
jgi:hypothetical protein